MSQALRSVRVVEIRHMMNTALAALEAAGVDEIPIATDAYWSIDPEDAFELGNKPELMVGVLDDDLGDLRKDLECAANGETVAVWHMFHHLRGIVMLLAEHARSRLI